MRLEGRRRSTNIQDRRAYGGRRRVGILGGGLGTIVIVLVAVFFGVDPGAIEQAAGPATEAPAPTSPEAQREYAFVSTVLASTEDTWNAIFADGGQAYREPQLVLFSGAVQSACGSASAAVGPFYCPADAQVYLDTGFFDQLAERFGAPGDFAQAYVIAHEVGHHVQNLLGIAGQVQQQRQRVSEAESNQLSVRMELQADCFAGVWAHHADRRQQILETGDLEEGLRAASAIGDDQLQRQAQGYVVPESFTHGSSEQRVRWFRRGFASGDVATCDTFQ